jgi:hypothetical protein
MSFDLKDSFRDFLIKAKKHNLIYYPIKLEGFICEKYTAKGLTREQIYQMPLKILWPLIKDYKFRRNRQFWIKKNEAYAYKTKKEINKETKRKAVGN